MPTNVETPPAQPRAGDPVSAPPRLPVIVWCGLAVVLIAAAVLSFDALRGLALAVGIPWRFAWLLPVAVDAGAAVSCAVWLGRRATADASAFAGRMTWALLAVTVLGNAAQLGMHAHAVVPPWWVAVAVGAIPPAVVGATVHLVVLLVRGGLVPAEQTEDVSEPVYTEAPAVQVEPEPVDTAPVQPAVHAPVPDVQQDETAEDRRLRLQRERNDRRKRHESGNHSTCNPRYCAAARRLQAVS